MRSHSGRLARRAMLHIRPTNEHMTQCMHAQPNYILQKADGSRIACILGNTCAGPGRRRGSVVARTQFASLHVHLLLPFNFKISGFRMICMNRLSYPLQSCVQGLWDTCVVLFEFTFRGPQYIGVLLILQLPATMEPSRISRDCHGLS